VIHRDFISRGLRNAGFFFLLAATSTLIACTAQKSNAVEPLSGGKPVIYTEEQAATVCYIQPTEELKKKLSPEEYAVLVQAATEPPFANAYWDNHKDGIYVDKIDGTPLFASSTKFESGTGWPSFWNPIDASALVLVQDKSFGMIRTEVRAKKSGGHLGHLFDDGPQPSGLRYCINSASLRFVPKENMAAEGFAGYLTLFDK
ncbi:MAG TPA: peptide-methionine (R)-S-oxide reductase MsrB, partial [Rectinemataceae bacterium]|nr:peptide-methionine (R)-S-oxide reductase MsrB [Rectinemataceae bacterium]